MKIDCSSRALISRSNVKSQSSSPNNSFQQKAYAKSPSFGNLPSAVVIIAGIVAVVPLMWIDNQKWSGKTLEEINKKAEMKASLKATKQNTSKISKLMTKLLTRANKVA